MRLHATSVVLRPSRTLLVPLVLLLIMVPFTCSSAQSSMLTHFKVVRITLKSGLTFDGKDASVAENQLTVMVNAAPQNFPMDDIQVILAKKGNAGKWATAFGLGCGAISLASMLVNADLVQGMEAEYFLSMALWMGITGGVGYIIGLAVDDWDTVYIGRQSAGFSIPIRFIPSVDRRGTLRLNLAIRFK